MNSINYDCIAIEVFDIDSFKNYKGGKEIIKGEINSAVLRILFSQIKNSYNGVVHR